MTELAGRIAVVENAELKQLGDVPADDVLAIMDQDVPDYRALYYRWERQQWEAGAIDLAADRRDWTDRMSADLRRSLSWGLSSFYVGADQVTNALVRFVDAASTEEQQVFLTTQLVDEARHAVFFDRFHSEVLDEPGDDMETRLERHTGRLNPGSRSLLLEMLPAAAERIRATPGDLGALVEGIVLCHIVIQATLALTVQRFLLNQLREEDLLPGFRQGFTAVARDEARHVNFAVRFLRETVASDARYADVIRDAVTRTTPVALTVLEPPEGDGSYFDPLAFGPGDLAAFATSSLQKRLGAIGV